MNIAQESGSLFDNADVKRALFILIGGGLDEQAKELWLSLRLQESMTAEAIFADAIRLVTA